MSKKVKTLMIQGSASHVGKSLLCTALCRIYRNMGYKVAPFKAQNMSNNSYATPDGGEIGRAQAAQAEACGIEPSPHMNPILLKPSSDKKAQVVVLGKAQGAYSAAEYRRLKPSLWKIVKSSFQELRNTHDIVIIEGAGSPSEINLKKDDIVNMRVAQMADAPVVIAGDIDKGGVFAQLTGTYELLDPQEKRRVKAFLINKFRGDREILNPGLKWIEERTHKKILGVIPFLSKPSIAEEDSVSLQNPASPNGNGDQDIAIDVLHLPRISNFTDFKPLEGEKGCRLRYVSKPDRHHYPDLLILPGTKSTQSDLKFLRKSGWEEYIQRCAQLSIPILGVCGGFQMLGKRILDPYRVESNQETIEGLGLLPHITVFRRNKTTAQVRAVHMESKIELNGYEIHMGCTQGHNGDSPLFKITERYGMPIEDIDGIDRFPFMGTYIHGIFDSPDFRRYFLNKIRSACGVPIPHLATPHPALSPQGRGGRRMERGAGKDPYDALAEIVERNIDMNLLNKIMGNQ